MLSGIELWDNSITSELVLCNYKGRRVYTYVNAAQNSYADLYDAATRHAGRAAVVHNGKSYTYSQLLSLVQKLSQQLYYDEGIKKGDYVALMLQDPVELCTAIYALAKLGAVVVPDGSCDWADVPVSFVLVGRGAACGLPLAQAGKRNVSVVEVAMEAVLSRQEQPVDDTYAEGIWEDDFLALPAARISGNRGWAILSNFNVANAMEGYRTVLGLTEQDTTAIAAPLNRAESLVLQLMLLLHCGGTVYLDSEKKDVTVLNTTPRELTEQMENGQPVIAKNILLRAPGTSMVLEKEWRDELPDAEINTLYCPVECSFACVIRSGDILAGKASLLAGIPLPGIVLKIVDENGDEVPVCEYGELCISGNTVLDRYYSSETTLSKDGWLHTGRIAKIGKNGVAYITDRLKDEVSRHKEHGSYTG